jgi:predicted ribonuclease toxin of YeeF-YezG toxin-antitoxin module
MLFFMAVMEREAWTDQRLDDLKESVNQRFDQVDKRFDQVDKKFEQVDTDIRELRSDMKTGFAEINARFDAMQRTMIIGFVSLVGTVVASVLGGILLTQL